MSNNAVDAANVRSPRRRGAPIGNCNALKHGRYTRVQAELDRDPMNVMLRNFERIARRRCGRLHRGRSELPEFRDEGWDLKQARVVLAAYRRALPKVLARSLPPRYRKDFVLGAQHAVDEILARCATCVSAQELCDVVCSVALRACDVVAERCDSQIAFVVYAKGWRWGCATYYSLLTERTC